MAKKRTKAQKKTAKNRLKDIPVIAQTNQETKQASVDSKTSFANQEKNYIINDLKHTIVYTLLVIAVLLGIFVYTKTS